MCTIVSCFSGALSSPRWRWPMRSYSSPRSALCSKSLEPHVLVTPSCHALKIQELVGKVKDIEEKAILVASKEVISESGQKETFAAFFGVSHKPSARFPLTTRTQTHRSHVSGSLSLFAAPYQWTPCTRWRKLQYVPGTQALSRYAQAVGDGEPRVLPPSALLLQPWPIGKFVFTAARITSAHAIVPSFLIGDWLLRLPAPLLRKAFPEFGRVLVELYGKELPALVSRPGARFDWEPTSPWLR